MALKQNTLDHQQEYSEAAKAALKDFYSNDGVVGTDSVDSAISLREELQCFIHWEASSSGNGKPAIGQRNRKFHNTFVISIHHA